MYYNVSAYGLLFHRWEKLDEMELSESQELISKPQFQQPYLLIYVF